jgi:ABC-type polysaccharide/polyol phosphate export permease
MYLQPLLFIGVLYIIFFLGLRAQTTMDVPFGLYLVCGIIPWMFFSSNFTSATNVIRSHSFLVKRVDFRLSVLPIVTILSGVIPHAFLVLVAIGIGAYNGYAPTLYTLQLLYYLTAMSLLLLGLGWLTSSTSIFIKDVVNVVSVLTQFGFWLTPVFWNINMMPIEYHWLIKLNPAYYIVAGYRDSIINRVPFWDKPYESIVFWSVTILVLIVGVSVYRRLRPHFAEVV